MRQKRTLTVLLDSLDRLGLLESRLIGNTVEWMRPLKPVGIMLCESNKIESK
jgi:hypothetical protein